MRRAVIGMFGAIASLAVGCGRSGDAPLVIASAWPEPARDELVSSYRREVGSSRPIAWVDLDPGDRPADALARRGGVDLILGGSPREYVGMAAAGLLEGPWKRLRRPETARIPGDEPRGEAELPASEFADPRSDPSTLELVASLVRGGDWPGRYADLVRRGARARPVIGAVARGRSALGDPDPAAGRDRLEGVALAKRGRNPVEAARFFAFLGGEETPGPEQAEAATVEGLLADLFGATLVDAHEELRAASIALDRNGHPAAAEGPFVEPPPWPPASVGKLRSDPDSVALLETLAEQVAPDPDVRAWLLESWDRPARPIDGALLEELAGAVGGRLAREPRFRAWLRAEWTAWARQRYRRVARVAGGWVPS